MLKIALIGCGTWGSSHAMLYHEDPRVEVAGICDINEARARALAEKIDLAPERVYTDYREMLKKSDCDAVAVVTPDFLHREYAVACAEAGKHVLIEKPLATTRADAEAMLEAIEKNRVRAMVDFHNRWSPPFAIMKEDIDRGSIGSVYSAYMRLVDQKWVATDMLKWAGQSSVLWFLGSHSVDTLRWLTGSEADVVYANVREGILKAEGVNTADMYQYSVKFKNGVIAQIENGWISPKGTPAVIDFKCNVLGTDGAYDLDLSSHTMIRRYTDTAITPDVLVNNFVRNTAAGFAYQSIRHFVDCLIKDEPFYVSLADAYNVTATLLAVFESACTGEPVRIRDLI